MCISPRNLWPEDIAVTDAVAPVSILKEQASLLGNRTRNLVEGSVSRRIDIDSFGDDSFWYEFDLVAPALNRYQYRLFSIKHSINFYPLTITG